MNLNNPEKGLIYTSNILANNLCVATGIAMAESVKQKSAVTTVITGDGAMEEGAFYESLLFMKSNHVSAIIVIENNEWSLATKIEERRHAIDVEKLVSSVNAKYISLKGNNVFEYVEAMNSARETAAKEKQVVVVEVKLSSLGHWIMKNDLNPNGKYINYHAGPAPTVDYEADIIIENSPEDPLSVLKTLIPVSDWDSIAMKIKANLEQEVGA
jgi:TPP-dependent pyruvate/acetoin dehydrogenase alpha subunit